MRRYMVTVRTIEGTKVESFTDYRDVVEYANKKRKTTDGVIVIKDNANGKQYVVN